MKEKAIVIEWTTDDPKEAEEILMHLLKSKCIACGNISSPIFSFYVWEGEIAKAKEIIVTMKTLDKYFATVKKEIVDQCHYETPEVISFPIQDVSEEYMQWLIDTLTMG